jgi:hypothetical protein
MKHALGRVRQSCLRQQETIRGRLCYSSTAVAASIGDVVKESIMDVYLGRLKYTRRKHVNEGQPVKELHYAMLQSWLTCLLLKTLSKRFQVRINQGSLTCGEQVARHRHNRCRLMMTQQLASTRALRIYAAVTGSSGCFHLCITLS